MVNQEIFGGLKLALLKGESLKQAMISFYNAGYSKQEIEEAARNLSSQKISEKTQDPPSKKVNKKTKKSHKNVSDYGRDIKKQVQSSQMKEKINTAAEKLKSIHPVIPSKEHKQKISDYEKKPKQMNKIFLFLLISVLIILIGFLVAVIFFRGELQNLLG